MSGTTASIATAVWLGAGPRSKDVAVTLHVRSEIKSFVRRLTLNRISGGLLREAAPTAALVHFP